MAYSIQQLADLAGISSRTLRYYDQIGLLVADRNPANGYREYTSDAVNRLQLIRYFQAFGFSLQAIQALLAQSPADQRQALADQRAQLAAKRDHLTTLLNTLDRTLAAQRGGPQMTDSEKFAAFKRDQITTNDREYGDESRQRYGATTFSASQQRYASLTESDYQAMQATEQRLFTQLKQVATTGNLDSPAAKAAYQAHRDWLCFTWNNCSLAAHRGLAQLYRDDDRFAAYYTDRVGLPNAAKTLVAIINHYTQ
ncbi:MerR family transcriptional regulator [Levilactobacillus tangyuanensis]|uniref:MerR family transcriptional regulator n=1 Tax=Levilactobacillus tangyuanensis TaxID=2486021 RepID=A0ABW1TNY3_9LACO|nr:MerR family transcriptional regulator [Levilactobacillus tangyuanensis]